MDQAGGTPRATPASAKIVRLACVDCQAADAVAQMTQKLQPGDLSLVVLFLSPQTDVSRLVGEAQRAFAPA